LHYNYGLGSGNVGPESGKPEGLFISKEIAQRTDSQPQSDAMHQMPQYGNCFTSNILRNQAAGATKNAQAVGIGRVRRNSFLSKRKYLILFFFSTT
jgi:aldehyde:ferredoxin oxidoreductase